MMKRHDAASSKRYCILRNKVTRLVRRNKQDSNLLVLKKANNDPKVLWGLADQALGKDRPSLPASVTGADRISTTTSLEAAEAVNKYFADKVYDLCPKALSPLADAYQVQVDATQVRVDAGHVPVEVPDDPPEVPDVPQEVNKVLQGLRQVQKFSFTFSNAKRISKTIRGLNNTEALENNRIPASGGN
jgi:hypothetical protein